ncbi:MULTISPECIES: hypothetical protein [unclassified Microcoleus]|uniref:hypothetical protein n=1 Tax=unclassified Microcoleus TaxID=2642155 RepID=UPI002FD58240
MSTKKRKPLGSAMEEFVFGDRETTPAPTAPEVVSQAPTSTASQTPETVEAVLPAPTQPSPEASALEFIAVQLKENSLTHRLQAPDKEATVRFTVDMSESLHRKLSMLAARTGRKKVDIVRMLLEDGLKEVEG